MSGTEHFGVVELNPYSHDDIQPDRALARQEHEAVARALMDAGVDIIKVEAPKDCQDGVYTANWGLCRGDKVILSSLPNKRQAEEPHAEKILRSLGKEIMHVPDDLGVLASSSWSFSQRGMERGVSQYDEVNPAAEKRAGTEETDSAAGSASRQVSRPGRLRFSGQGDALPCGNLLFAGSQYRTDPRIHDFIAEQLGYEVIGLQTIPELDENGIPMTNHVTGWPDSFFYDIDLALAVLREDLIVWCPEAFLPESQAKIRALDLEKIEVSLDEAMYGFACNLVSTGETVVMSAHAPQLQAAIEAKGLRTITPEIQELAKGGGYIRCTTLTLDNAY